MSYAVVPVRPIAGRLALDFLNTADWSTEGAVIHEKLTNLDDLARWTAALGITEALSGPQPMLPALLDLRRHLRQVVLSAVGGRAAAAESVRIVGRALSRAYPGLTLAQSAEDPVPSVAAPLAELIAASAVALMSDPREIGRVRLCRGRDCGWIFLDESRNASRKWCMMSQCGNREKARRHHARAKAR